MEKSKSGAGRYAPTRDYLHLARGVNNAGRDQNVNRHTEPDIDSRKTNTTANPLTLADQYPLMGWYN
jgi:hypothetical protein